MIFGPLDRTDYVSNITHLWSARHNRHDWRNEFGPHKDGKTRTDVKKHAQWANA